MLVACTKSGFALTSVEVTHSKELIGPVALMAASTRRAMGPETAYGVQHGRAGRDPRGSRQRSSV